MEFIKPNIYCLNIAELKKICHELGIDCYYYVRHNDKLVRGRMNKKIIVIKNILKVLNHGKAKLTIIPANVVCFDKLKNIDKSSKVYYGQYINGNKQILRLMKKLTNNEFKFGVIAQDILFDNWRRSKLLSYNELAAKWLKYKSKSHPEWNFIQYVRDNGSADGWKEYRKKLAKKVIKEINKKLNLKLDHDY